MFNYKTWKLYYPNGESAIGINDPLPGPKPKNSVDGNGNSITPDSLKKNITIPAESPANDLEKTLSNINGADPAYPVEGGSGLIKQLNKFAENPHSGGGVFIVHIDDTTGLDKTMGEIQEAWTRGDRIDIISGMRHFMPYILEEVHYDDRADPPGYVGSVRVLYSSNTAMSFSVKKATEDDALNAYPTRT